MTNNHMVVLMIRTDRLELIQAYKEFANILIKASETKIFDDKVRLIKRAESKRQQFEELLERLIDNGPLFVESFKESQVEAVTNPVLKNRLKNGLFNKEEMEQVLVEEIELSEEFKRNLYPISDWEKIIFWNMEEKAADALLSN
jgi:hypothetical protein